MFRDNDARREVTRSPLGQVSRDITRFFGKDLASCERNLLSIYLAEADEQTCEAALTTTELRARGAGSNLGRICAIRKCLVDRGFLEWIMDRRIGNRGRVGVFKISCPPIGAADETSRQMAEDRPSVAATDGRKLANGEGDSCTENVQQSDSKLAAKCPIVETTVSREPANSGEKIVPPHTPPSERVLNTELAAQARALEAVTAISIYNAYPRKVARRRALRAIDQALKRLTSSKSPEPSGGWAAWLLDRTRRYHDIRRRHWSDEVEKFTPHPATWFNDERYHDDPETWEPIKTRGTANKTNGVPNEHRIGNQIERYALPTTSTLNDRGGQYRRGAAG